MPDFRPVDYQNKPAPGPVPRLPVRRRRILRPHPPTGPTSIPCCARPC